MRAYAPQSYSTECVDMWDRKGRGGTATPD